MLVEFCFSILLMWCKGIIQSSNKVNDEFEKRFPTQDVMDALGIVHININLNRLQKKFS